jgi:hypothetical protein
MYENIRLKLIGLRLRVTLARNIRIQADLVDQLFDPAKSGSRECCSCSHGTARPIPENGAAATQGQLCEM